jgi:uncharacterized membrane protein YphA (DoxX/SURF4 family)
MVTVVLCKFAERLPMLSAIEVTRRSIVSFSRVLPILLLVVLFGFSAIDKLIHLSGFTIALHDYHVLPVSTERYAAFFIIMAEATISIGLLIRRWRRSACLSGALLLAFFTIVYLAAAPEGACGCWFTLTMAKGRPLHIIQNLIFVGLAVLTWLDSRILTDEPEGAYPIYAGLNSAVYKGEPDSGKLGSSTISVPQLMDQPTKEGVKPA